MIQGTCILIQQCAHYETMISSLLYLWKPILGIKLVCCAYFSRALPESQKYPAAKNITPVLRILATGLGVENTRRLALPRLSPSLSLQLQEKLAEEEPGNAGADLGIYRGGWLLYLILNGEHRETQH